MKKTKEVTLTIHNFESFPLDIDYPLKNREYRKKRKNTVMSDGIAMLQYSKIITVLSRIFNY